MIHVYTHVCFGTSSPSPGRGALLLQVLFLHGWLDTDDKKSAVLHPPTSVV